MIRLKQSMGNLIKCKIDGEEMISKYECSILKDNRLNSLFSVQTDKPNVLSYGEDIKRKLSDLIEFGMKEEEVNSYLYQIARVMADVKGMGLNPGKIVMHSDWIYLSRDNKTLKFIYCPVNGISNGYDGILYMRDFLFASAISKDIRDWWKQWLDEVSVSGITEQAIKKIEVVVKEGRTGTVCSVVPERKNVSSLDEAGEAMTGQEKGIWDSYSPMNYDWGYTQQRDDPEEAFTGRADSEEVWGKRMTSEQKLNEYRKPDTKGYYGDDGEAPTGVDIDEMPQGLNKKQEAAHRPTLIRANTGECVTVINDNFKLGRSEQRADFCIRKNSGISNVHATVMYKGGQYFLKDNYSTNGSYVNGNKILDSSVPVLLQDGSVIQLYNEEIIFHL